MNEYLVITWTDSVPVRDGLAEAPRNGDGQPLAAGPVHGAGEPRPAPAREPRWQRAAGYANQAVLPFYVLHEPVIVAFAWIIVRWHAPVLIQYPVLVAASFTATFVIYELAVRRYRITRLLSGMKQEPPRTDDRSGQARRTVMSGGCQHERIPRHHLDR